MTGEQLWRRACTLVLLVAIPNFVGAIPNRPVVQAEGLQLLVANPEKGSEIFQNRCNMCHAVRQGDQRKFGPNLHGLLGRKAGTLPGYTYSSDMRNSGIVWNSQTLDKYLADPHRDSLGVKMPYPGLSGKTDRDDLISYLEQATR
jgi:cytochrome c